MWGVLTDCSKRDAGLGWAGLGCVSQEIAQRLQENEEKVKELHSTVRDLHNKLRATVQRSDNLKRDMDKECARLKADIDLWVRVQHLSACLRVERGSESR